MSEQEKVAYEHAEELRQVIKNLRGKKFILDCGHKVTFGYFLGNDVTICNGKEPTIICRQCCY